MENCLPLIPVHSSRVRLLRSQRLRRQPAAGELCSHARGFEQQFFFQFHNLYNYSVKRHDDYIRWVYNYRNNRGYRNYRNHDHRDDDPDCFPAVNGCDRQCRQPASGELHPDAGGLHSYDDYFYNYWDNRNYRDYRRQRDNRNYRNYRRHNKYFVVVNGGGKQSRRPASG
jgi:hypothetical protein